MSPLFIYPPYIGPDLRKLGVDEWGGQGVGKSPGSVSVLHPFIITCSAFGKFHACGFCTENACACTPLRFFPTPGISDKS